MPAPQISQLPEAPSRADDGATFSSKADAFVASLSTFRQQTNTSADFVNTKATEVSNDAASAAQSAATATDKALAAEGAANTYDDTAAGLAATSDGEYFTIPAPDASDYLALYRNDSGVATLVRTSPSNQVLTDAESARDAAQTAEQGAAASLSAVQDLANFYPDVATALGATVDGDHFRVMASGNTAANLYRNDAGSETLIGTFPTEEGLQAWEQKLRQDIVDLVKNPDEIPVKTLFFLGESGSFIDVSSAGV